MIKTYFALLLTVTVFPLFGGSDSASTGGSWSLMGLPNLGYNNDDGVIVGAMAGCYRKTFEPSDPYSLALELKYMQSFNGMYDANLFMDLPRFFKADWRLNAMIWYKHNYYENYFGLGNRTAMAKKLFEGHHYHYDMEFTRVFSHLFYRIIRFNYLCAGLYFCDLKAMPVTTGTQTSLYQASQDITGYGGGQVASFKLGWTLDRRNREKNPSHGIRMDWIAEISSPVLGSDFTYRRYTAKFRHYIPMGSRAVLAANLMMESAQGQMPFFEMVRMGSNEKMAFGLGGEQNLRGYFARRFTGPSKFLFMMEPRFYLFSMEILKQRIDWGTHLFWDTGRVFTADDSSASLFNGLHHSYGFGVTGTWNRNFIGNLDVGFSEEDAFAIYTGFGRAF